jgi:hypothetical protein
MLTRALTVGVVGVGIARGAEVAHVAARIPEDVVAGSTGDVCAGVRAAGNCRELSNGVRLDAGSGSFEVK